MLVSSKEMLCKAREEGYAVGSFNIFNLESAKAIISKMRKECYEQTMRRLRHCF